jgi:hypothetical protein
MKDSTCLGETRGRLDVMDESDLSVLQQRAQRGDEDAVDQLIELAGEQGNLEELRRLADQGNTTASDQLIELAAEQGNVADERLGRGQTPAWQGLHWRLQPGRASATSRPRRERPGFGMRRRRRADGPQLGCARPQSPCRGGQTEQVMEYPRSRFGRAERIKRDYEREADSLVEGDPVGRVGCWTDRSTNRSSSQGPM